MDSKWKSVLFWIGILCLCFVGIPIHLTRKSDETNKDLNQVQLQTKFQNYTKYFNKTYTEEEALLKLSHFKKSLEQIHLLNFEEMNSENKTVKYGNGDSEKKITKRWRDGMHKNSGSAAWGLTSFADMSREEFESTYLDKSLLQRIERRWRSHRPKDNSEDHLITRRKRAAETPIPNKVDWRAKNTVTEVRHQRACGACWAFSTVETVESMYAIQKGHLKTLSVQQVIDCSTDLNNGCNGGDTCAAIHWMSTHKLATELEYPLTLKDGKCKLNSVPSGVEVNGNYSCGRYLGKEESILEVLANHGPVAVAVDATNWQFYMGGIIQWNCDNKVNHAVQIVGYDKTSEPPHYILRNSWGPVFGDKGYLYVAIGSNLCGIATEVTYLSVK